MTELDRRVEELAATQHGVFSTRQVLLLQGTEKAIAHRVRTGRWHRDRTGVLRLLGAPPGRSARLMGLVVASDHRAVVSHRAAARSHGLPGFERAGDEITLPRPTTFARSRPVVVHETNCLPPHHVTAVDRIPTTTIARTLFDLTAVVPPGRSARAIDHALARRSVTYATLVGILLDVSRRGRRRSRWFRLLLAERGPLYRPPESELERRFAELVGRCGIGTWERQVDLGDEAGWIGRVDFYRRDARLIVEVDGALAHSALLDRRSDAERDRRNEAAGFATLRFGWADVVHDANRTVDTIRRALAERTLRSP